jgi:hypothetical protein
MPTLLGFHEVDDVDHWLSSPKQEEVFGPLGITVPTFRDPEGSNRVRLIVEVPDMAASRDQRTLSRRGLTSGDYPLPGEPEVGSA